MTRSILMSALAAACGLTAHGCGPGKVEPVMRVKVSGVAKVDGKDVKAGKIVFDAQNGQPPTDMTILDGKYEGLAPVGKCKVTISSLVKMTMKEKTKKDGPGYDQLSEFELLPERYNTKSTIIREVTEPGPHTFDFADMTSGK